MEIIRITKEFNFETAHSLFQYDGLCKNIHGHSYKLFVTVKGTPIKDDNNPKNGMVLDFGILKKIVNEEIVDLWDHAMIVYQNVGEEKIKAYEKVTKRLIVTQYQPSCENMVIDFVKKIKNKLPKEIVLHSVKLYETAGSCAEWNINDHRQ